MVLYRIMGTRHRPLSEVGSHYRGMTAAYNNVSDKWIIEVEGLAPVTGTGRQNFRAAIDKALKENNIPASGMKPYEKAERIIRRDYGGLV